MEIERVAAQGPALADTSRRNIGFVLAHEQFPVPELVEFGARAEQAGFDTVWTSDHFQPWQANEGHAGFAWVTLAAVGQRTQRIPFGTGVTCPTYRYNPAIVAEAFASMGILYPGRVFLGVGSGEALNESASGGGWGNYQERAARLVEAVEVIRRLWTGEPVQHKGDFYEVNGRLYDIPQVPIPIYIAAAGPKSARLAGRYGDGLITDSKSAQKPEMRQAFEEGARQAGKDPRTMPIIAEHWVCVGDRAEAKKGAQLWQFLPKAWTEFVTDADPVDIMRRARRQVPLDQVVDMFSVSDDPNFHIQTIQSLWDAGITTVYVHSAQEDQRSIIDWFGDRVLTQLKRAGAPAGSSR